jgi:hypothetical protein
MSEQHASPTQFDEIEASFTEDINSEHNMDFLSAVNESPNEAHDMDHMPAAITQRLHPGSEFANPNEFFDIITQASIHTVRCFAMESILPVLLLTHTTLICDSFLSRFINPQHPTLWFRAGSFEELMELVRHIVLQSVEQISVKRNPSVGCAPSLSPHQASILRFQHAT